MVVLYTNSSTRTPYAISHALFNMFVPSNTIKRVNSTDSASFSGRRNTAEWINSILYRRSVYSELAMEHEFGPKSIASVRKYRIGYNLANPANRIGKDNCTGEIVRWMPLHMLERLHASCHCVNNSQSCCLHWDNSPLHTAPVTLNILASRSITTLKLPPYSPDLAPCDYFLFPTLKSELADISIRTKLILQKVLPCWGLLLHSGSS